MFSEGTVKVRGPVSTSSTRWPRATVRSTCSNRALRKAIRGSTRACATVHLVDYKVRILDSASGTAAMTRGAD